MILITITEDLNQILLKIAELVDLLETDSYNFTSEAIDFLTKTEKKLKEYHLPIESDIALIRGKLINIEANPVHVVEDGYTNTRKERKKVKNQKTMECLEEVHKTIREFIQHANDVFTQCSELCMQLLSRSISCISDLSSEDRENLKNELWGTISANEELAPVLNHVVGLCGLFNAKIIFERSIHYVIEIEDKES